MDTEEFRKHAHSLVEWMAAYLEEVEQHPVRPSVAPREIIDQIPGQPPSAPEEFEQIFRDFQRVILPGMTHWQHPSFHAYFPANTSPPSILAEMLTATMGAQCMSWATSPAATELEERMMEWLREMIGLPADFTGVIQDTASTATLCALLTARERTTGYRINNEGFPHDKRFAVYCSTEAHSSIEKAVKIVGVGRSSLRKVAVDNHFAMRTAELERSIVDDIAEGCTPLCVVAALGTTGSTAIDPLKPIGELCKHYGIFLHVDAAYAGTALILPDMRWMIDGIELADSFVFNPHKWMFTNFDCSAYFVRDTDALVRTFEILPEYLRSSERERVHNYRDWGLQMGRRFRALKLWFVIRSFGVTGLQDKVRSHIALAQAFKQRIETSADFELLAPVPLATVCFRFHPRDMDNPESLNALNEGLLERLNRTGRLFITHTKLNDRFTLRLVVGQTNVAQRHIDQAWELISHTARTMSTDTDT